MIRAVVLLLAFLAPLMAQYPKPGGGGTSTGSAAYDCTVTAVSSIACTHSLNTSRPWVVCYETSPVAGAQLGSNGATTTSTTNVSSVKATSANVATIEFSGSTTAVCSITTGAMGPAGATGATGATGASGSSAAEKVRVCEIPFGDPGTASTALADDNDAPTVCSNDSGSTMTITAVHCYAPTGSPQVTPIITGGSSTSILSGALTCTNAAGGAAGTLNGTPTQTNGQTIDANITTAGGTAKYLVIRITRTL